MPFDLPAIRSKFPALKHPAIFFDNPGGTQVAQPVLDRMNAYLVDCNANHGGAFETSRASDAILDGVRNPVFLLDEVDKMSTDFRGDPSSALLEVLDPEQNHTFGDHFLDVDYDLSSVMFIATANTLHASPRPLRDRMEVIRIEGYTEEEKLGIAERYLLPKQIETHGLKPGQVRFSEAAGREILRRYTREAGVRSLERELATICRKIARDVVRNGTPGTFQVGAQQVRKYLGVPRYSFGIKESEQRMRPFR